LSTQPLPTLADAQVKPPGGLHGALHPAGIAVLPDIIPNPLIGLPSVEVNVTLTVRAVSNATETTSGLRPAEAVATTKSLLPVGDGVPEIGSRGGALVALLLLPLPFTPVSVPLLLLYELDPQPHRASAAATTRRNDPRVGSIH